MSASAITGWPGPGGRAAAPAVLQALRLAAGYDRGRQIVRPVDLVIRAGRFVSVLGPNGAGKTTLLRTLAGVLEPLGGQVIATPALHGGSTAVPLSRLKHSARARHIAVVLTDHPDVGLLRARDIVAIGRHPYTGWSGRLGPEDHAAVDAALEAVGALDLAGAELATLSDGQRQRIWIARALAQQPAVLLLDEPTAYLDLPGKVETAALLRTLARDQGIAVVASIHDLDLALRMADEAWLLDSGGRLVTGAPEDLALDGLLDGVFGREGLRFDAATGSFERPAAPHQSVGLVEEGPVGPARLLWTRRALTRVGLDVVDQPRQVTVHVGPQAWQVHGPGGITAVTTLGALVDALEAVGLPPHLAGTP